jgi:hypothetical protein
LSLNRFCDLSANDIKEMLRDMIKIRGGLILAIVSLAFAGCSAGPVLEQLPASVGGLPEDAPAAPKAPYQYPAVHDLPPPRSTHPMTDEDLLKAEDTLRAARDRQEQMQKEIEDEDKQN